MHQSHLIDMTEPECSGCGGRGRYRSRRGATTVWECPDPECPVVLIEIHDPSMPAGRTAQSKAPRPLRATEGRESCPRLAAPGVGDANSPVEEAIRATES